jgi:hypothetical protein
MLAVAEWLRRRAVTPATRVRFSPVNPICAEDYVSGRSVSGKPSVFEADFGRSIRSLPATAGSFSGRTLLSDSRCRWFESIPGCQILSGYRSRDRIERYERSDCRSSRHTRANPAFVQSGEDAALRTLKFRFESGGLDQVLWGRIVSCAPIANIANRRKAVVADRQGA